MGVSSGSAFPEFNFWENRRVFLFIFQQNFLVYCLFFVNRQFFKIRLTSALQNPPNIRLTSSQAHSLLSEIIYAALPTLLSEWLTLSRPNIFTCLSRYGFLAMLTWTAHTSKDAFLRFLFRFVYALANFVTILLRFNSAIAPLVKSPYRPVPKWVAVYKIFIADCAFLYLVLPSFGPVSSPVLSRLFNLKIKSEQKE